MKLKKIYDIANELPVSDAEYLLIVASIVAKTTGNHGPNGVGGIVDDKCEVCQLVCRLIEIEEMD